MSGFVGYWGCGANEDLELLLTRCLDAGPQPVQRLNLTEPPANGKHPTLAGVARWGLSARAERLATGGNVLLSASLAASCLPATEDVWVKAEPGCLRLGREAFGRATLYWTQQEGVVWFASRLQSLLPLLASKPVALDALYGYSCFSFVPTPLTPVQNVYSIPAGEELTWRPDASRDVVALERDSVRLSEWQDGEPQIESERDATQQLRGLLEKAIDRQLGDCSSGTVAVFLSGGLDSSVTAALLVRAGITVRAYTLDFGEFGFSEVPYAERVAEALSIPLVRVPATPQRIRDAIDTTARALDIPFGDGVTVPLLLLCEAAKDDSTIVFNGEGGDQLFGGWTNKPLIASRVYQDHHPDGSQFNQHYLRTFHRLHGYESSAFTDAARTEMARVDPLDWLSPALDDEFTNTLLHRLRRANLMLKGAQNIQPRATALAHANCMSVRTPFCDPEIGAWTFRLAGDLCLRGPCEKYLLKRAVEDWLPSDIVWREKRGMGVPLTAWCLGPLAGVIDERLNASVLEAEGRYLPDLPSRVAQGRLSGHVQGRRIGEILWLLLMWEAWRQTVLKEEIEHSTNNWLRLPRRWRQFRARHWEENLR